MLAYLGRYGHQPVDVAKRLTVRELHLLSEKVAEIVQEENEANSPSRD